MKENKTTYSYLIEHMEEPSFQKIWGLAYDFVHKLPDNLCNELHESLNKGVNILDSEPLMQMYIYAFGKMHNAKLQYAFNHLHKSVLKYKEIEIVDYGCGQGLATVCYHDFMIDNNLSQKVSRITLIEPSPTALYRAELICSHIFPDAKIIAINKSFDVLNVDDLTLSAETPTIHLLSNILDVESYDIAHFSQIVKELSIGCNEYVLVSPMQNTQRLQRLKDFVSVIEKTIYFESYLDKRQLDEEKDWTCVVILSTSIEKQNIIKYDPDRIFEEADSYRINIKDNRDEKYSKELFEKIKSCAISGDRRCQNQLGLWYEVGIGTEKNLDLALEWYMKSAEQGYPSAYKNIVILYELYRGHEIIKQYDKVYQFFLQASQNDDAEMMYYLAKCFYYGIGIKKNNKQAFQWFNKSSKEEYSKAHYAVGLCYHKGIGVGIDIIKSIEYYTKAGMLRDKRAIKKLVELFEKKEYKDYFENAQFDVFVNAVNLGMSEEVSRITKSWLNREPKEIHDGDVVYGSNMLRILKTLKR